MGCELWLALRVLNEARFNCGNRLFANKQLIAVIGVLRKLAKRACGGEARFHQSVRRNCHVQIAGFDGTVWIIRGCLYDCLLYTSDAADE